MTSDILIKIIIKKSWLINFIGCLFFAYISSHFQHRINIETHASRCVDINILVEDEELTSKVKRMDGMPISSDAKNSGNKAEINITTTTIQDVEANLHAMSR